MGLLTNCCCCKCPDGLTDPIPITTFEYTVTGIEDSFSASYEAAGCRIFSQSLNFIKQEWTDSYTINIGNLGDINGTYTGIISDYNNPDADCDECEPCSIFIEPICADITGSITISRTYNNYGSVGLGAPCTTAGDSCTYDTSQLLTGTIRILLSAGNRTTLNCLGSTGLFADAQVILCSESGINYDYTSCWIGEIGCCVQSDDDDWPAQGFGNGRTYVRGLIDVNENCFDCDASNPLGFQIGPTSVNNYVCEEIDISNTYTGCSYYPACSGSGNWVELCGGEDVFGGTNLCAPLDCDCGTSGTDQIVSTGTYSCSNTSFLHDWYVTERIST